MPPGAEGAAVEAAPARRRRRGRAQRRPTPTARTERSRCRADLDADEDDDYENNLSLAAMEAEIKPKVLETFDRIADNYKKLRKLQDALVEGSSQSAHALAGAGAPLQEAAPTRSSPT